MPKAKKIPVVSIKETTLEKTGDKWQGAEKLAMRYLHSKRTKRETKLGCLATLTAISAIRKADFEISFENAHRIAEDHVSNLAAIHANMLAQLEAEGVSFETILNLHLLLIGAKQWTPD